MDHTTWPTAILALATLGAQIVTWLKQRETTKKVEETKTKIQENTELTHSTKEKVEEVGKAVNGRMEQFLSAYVTLIKAGTSSFIFSENERVERARSIIGQRDERNKNLMFLAEGCPTLSCKVLMIEDDPLDAALLLRVFEKLGYSTNVAKDSTEAITWLETTHYDAIFIDLVLRGQSLDGYELIRLISGARPKVPVFVVSGSVDIEVSEAAKINGAVGVLSKPVTLEAIKALYDRILISGI